jgi:nanoRNase/pAp phosphatase (c-di-AMP/oligoRNAs hydrolase)
MAYSTQEQFISMLERSNRPLVVLGEHANPDDFVCAFGVGTLLKRLQKPVEIVSAGGTTPKSLHFLKHDHEIRGDIEQIAKLTLKIKASDTKVDELSYNMEGDELHIHVTPKSGRWDPNDIAIEAGAYKYDVIIAIGTADLESFGPLYKRYSDFFLQTPIINIDHASHNEHFGQINVIDMSAVSCSEVCYNLFDQIDKTLIDEQVATYFLTGMIYKTRSFRSENVTPKTLKIAGDLIGKGAHRDDIVKHLYKTRSVETLRLWGRALARLKSDKDHCLVWTMLTKQDFVNAGTDEGALDNIVDELLMNAPEAGVAVILYESQKDGICATIHARRPHDALFLGAPFKAFGTRESALLKIKDQDLVHAERSVISHLQEQLGHLT